MRSQRLLRATRPAAAIGLLIAAWCMFAVDAAAQALPVLSIDSPTVNEGDSGSTSMVFTVRLSASSASQVTVNYADAGTGTATSGTDYDAVTAGQLTFAPGTRSQAITVTVQGDITVEADETVVIALSSPSSGATLSTTASSGTGTISNDDTLPVLSIDSPSVNEGDSGSTSMVFTVRLSAAYSQDVTVDYADAGTGTATSGTDYTALTAGTLTIAAGATSGTIPVTVQGDTTSEPDETVAIILSNPTNATVSTATGTGTIEDNDTLSISSPSVDEGDSGSTDLVFTVSLNGSKTTAVTVNYADAGTGTATSGTDYDAVTAGQTLTFAAGTTSQTITVSVTGDITVEADETVVINLSSPSSGAMLSATASSGTGTISNDDTLPVLSIDSPSVNEGDSGSTNLTFTVTLSAAYSQDVTVTYADTLTGTATSGTDYTAVSATTLTITAGTTSGTFNVSVQGDTTSEADETVVISLGNPTNATVSTAPRTGTGTGTITDNDTLSISSPFVDEGDSGSANLVFTVSLGGTKATAVTVNYADAGTGTATSGTDYTAVTAGQLTLAAGTTSGTITVEVTGDTTVEADETVVIALSSASGATLSATASSGTGTIRDDDGTTPTFSIDSPTVNEGDSGSTNMTFTVRLSPAASSNTRVIFGITGGTATSGTDYTTSLQNNRITLRFNAGETSKTVSVAVQGDTLDEPDETVVAQLSGAFPIFSTRIDSSANTGTGTITDDDTSDITIDSPTVVEGDTGSRNMTFTVSLSTANSRQVTVPYGANPALSTATRGTDYRTTETIDTSQELLFAPGETSKTITVEVLGDRTDEPDETVVVQLGTPTNANLELANRRGTGTITDDDLAWLRTGPVSVAEGDSGSTNLNFTITLSDPAGEQITVAYADTGRGTATSGTDYTALAAGTMTIAQGATTGTIAVEVLGDGVTERDETIELALSNPTNARFVVQSMATWTGTIRDDDGFPVANAGADQTVSEGATVTLTGSGSDPDGDPITEYRWTQTAGPAVTLTSRTTTTTSFTAPTGLVADEVLRFSFVVTAGGEGGSDSVDVTVNATTVNWTVDAGDAQTVEEDNPVMLQGRTMSGGADLVLQGVRQPAYSWRHTAGAATVNMRGANTATPSFTAPNLLANTDLTFTMTVTIGDETMTDTMVLTVEADNDDPVANAGPDMTVWEGSPVTLPGSGWDPEGESLAYAWTQTGGIPTVTLTGASSPRPRFTAPRTTVDLTLTFELTVTAGGASHTDTVEVTVQELVLLANAGPDQVVGEGETVRLDGTRSTVPFGESIAYSWSQTGGGPSVTLTGATTARPSFIAPSGLPSDVTLTFTLTITLGGESGEFETDTVDVTVESSGPIFTPPLLTADAGPDQTVNEGDTVYLDGSGSTGSGGEALTYSWRQTGGPTVTLTDATSATPNFIAPEVTEDATLTFALTVAEAGDSDTDTVDVTVVFTPPPPPPPPPPPLSLTADAGPDQTVDEGDAVRLDGSGTTVSRVEELTYSWHQTGGSPRVTLAGAASARPSFRAPDVAADATLTFTLTVTAAGESDTDTVDVTIHDVPTLSIDSPSPSVREGDSGTADLTFTVSLSAANVRQVTVAYATADGTASAEADYRKTSGELQFAPGETEQTVTVQVLGDTRPEADETFTVTLSSPVNAKLARAEATGTIVNDDTVVASVVDAWAEEGDSGAADLDFTVTLSSASNIEVMVSYATADGTASAGTDYRAASGELRFAPGETEQTVSVQVLGDKRPEADETFTLTLSSPVNAEVAHSEATGTIVNDDTALASIADARMEEGDDDATDLDFTVTLSPASDVEVTVSYATADGTASAGKDYRAASGELRFAPGETEQTVSVPVLGDIRPEADETFTLTLSSPVNAELARAEATGTIVNDDMALASVADARMEEGDDGATDLDFTVTLSVAGDLEVTMAYATADGTASAGKDYRAASGKLRFAPGEMEQTVSVPVLGDMRPEVDETFTLTLSSPVNAELARAEATGTIVNDDTALASVADARMEEGDGGATDLDFTVTLSVAGDLEVTMAYATADGTASAGEDYQAASGKLMFAPGETEQTVSVPVLGDMRPEADETFTLTLSSPVNAELTRAEATGTIVNDDTALASIADVRAEEGNSGVADVGFTVTLSTAGDLAVTVAYATADGTANAGTDYQAASGELMFAPGETEQTVSVPVLGDTTPETDETFTVTLSSPSNAELATTEATGTIVDDDVAGARAQALEASMASFGRTLARDAVGAISGRFDGTSAARGSQMVLGGSSIGRRGTAFAGPFASWGRDLAQPPQLDSHHPWRSQLSLRDFLQRSSFQLALSEGGDGEDGDDAGWNLSLWGRASSGRFSGQPSTGLSSDGDVVTGYVGMDAKVGECVFAGVALAHSSGDISYGISDFAGDLDISLTSVLPYANFQINEKLEIWSVVGIGWGEADFQDAVRSAQAQSPVTRGTLDLGLRMAAVGANRSLATWRNVDLELKSDAFVMFLEGEPGESGAPDIKARSQGVRLTLAGRKELMASERGRLGANLEFGGRWDGGDAQTGAGTEVGGGLDYRHAAGLGVVLRGQYLLFHNAQSFEEKGASLTVEFDPGVQGQGYSLALRPAWGAYPGGAGELWNNEALLRIGGTPQDTVPGMASERLDLEWGYGLGLRGNTGELRLHGTLSHHGAGQRRYSFGGLLDRPGRTRSTLELTRQEWLGVPNHGLLITWEHKQ